MFFSFLMYNNTQVPSRDTHSQCASSPSRRCTRSCANTSIAIRRHSQYDRTNKQTNKQTNKPTKISTVKSGS